MPDVLDTTDIMKRLVLLRKQYEPRLQGQDEWQSDAFRVGCLYRKAGVLVDLGGGISAHNGVLAQLGMTVYVVDMLGDYWEHRDTEPASITREVQLLEACGVRFIQHDVSTCDLRRIFDDNSIDVVTSFHCLEHLHRSPRLVLESAMSVLKLGGTMSIEVPNAANARKRLAVLFGDTNYGSYNSLYYSEIFLGHIREYTTGDLLQLAQNLGALRYRITGRNTISGDWVQKIPSTLRKSLDRALQVFPGFCSSLVLEIVKLKEVQFVQREVRRVDGDYAREVMNVDVRLC
jgi:2-polyprenyl-3-methyl-5-hydroxy-6-metoxy-1,4-benzoquinol methylase